MNATSQCLLHGLAAFREDTLLVMALCIIIRSRSIPLMISLKLSIFCQIYCLAILCAPLSYNMNDMLRLGPRLAQHFMPHVHWIGPQLCWMFSITIHFTILSNRPQFCWIFSITIHFTILFTNRPMLLIAQKTFPLTRRHFVNLRRSRPTLTHCMLSPPEQ